MGDKLSWIVGVGESDEESNEKRNLLIWFEHSVYSSFVIFFRWKETL